MSTTMKTYRQLETRIKKGDLAALTARWLFGCKLLAERGDAKRLPDGRLEELANALATSRAELKNRIQFAEEYPTKADVSAAFDEYGSWSEICARGMGTRADAVEQVEGDPLDTLLSGLDQVLADARAVLLDLREHAVGHTEVREVDVRDMLELTDKLHARYSEVRARRWTLLGRWPVDQGLRKFVIADGGRAV